MPAIMMLKTVSVLPKSGGARATKVTRASKGRQRGAIVYKVVDKDLLVSNPASNGNASPAHALYQAPSQTFPPRPTICISIWIVHGDGLRACKGVLPASAHPILKVVAAAHHGGGTRVGIEEVGGGLDADALR